MQIKKILVFIIIVIVLGAAIAELFDLGRYYRGPFQSNPCANSPVSKIVKIAETGERNYLADEKCMTIYFNTTDQNGVPACVDDCITSWKPLYYTYDHSKFPEGIYKKMNIIKVNHGTDGSYYYQYSFGGYPLFTYRGDEKPGDMKGEDSKSDGWSALYLVH